MCRPESKGMESLPCRKPQDAGRWNPLSAGLQPKKPCFQRPKDDGRGDGRDRKFVVAMGLVSRSSFSLHLLDLSAAPCCCSSFGVPSETRAERLDVDASLPRERRSPFFTTPPPTIPGSPRGLNIHKSPQIHLYRSPVSHSANRGVSVPDSPGSLPVSKAPPEEVHVN